MSHAPTPPPARSPLWTAITQAAQEKRFILQVCGTCARVQYPPREVCRTCLSDELIWRDVDPEGTVLTHTDLHISTSRFFSDRLPWFTGSIQLKCGPIIFAHLSAGARNIGINVTVINRLDPSGQGVFIAVPKNASPPPEVFEFTDLLTEH